VNEKYFTYYKKTVGNIFETSRRILFQQTLQLSRQSVYFVTAGFFGDLGDDGKVTT
jgi:hypothetical protein